MSWFELFCSVGSAICVPVYVLWNLLHPKSKQIRRLRAIVNEAHREHRELRIIELEAAEWEGRQYQGWLRVHQAATKALKDYGPDDPYRGSAAPGRDALLEIQNIAAEALSTGPAADEHQR